jgi:hypothetical protein
MLLYRHGVGAVAAFEKKVKYSTIEGRFEHVCDMLDLYRELPHVRGLRGL